MVKLKNTERKKVILFVVKSVSVIIWITWTCIFPLFIDETIFQEGNLSGYPILNPYYGISIPIALLLLIYLYKEFKKTILKKEKSIEEN